MARELCELREGLPNAYEQEAWISLILFMMCG